MLTIFSHDYFKIYLHITRISPFKIIAISLLQREVNSHLWRRADPNIGYLRLNF